MTDDPSKSAYDFYSLPKVAADYERGRTARVFVRNLPEVLPLARKAGRLAEIPLYALFDWLYNKRLNELSWSMLGTEVLDIACGTSYVYRALMTDGWTGKVAGMDYSSAMIAEGTEQLLRMCDYDFPPESAQGGLFEYQDVLGRSVIDIAPPRNLIDKDSLEYLIQNRYVGKVEELPERRYKSVTSFSGPFCFFPASEQRILVKQVCKRAEALVSFQFKNATFAALGTSPDAVQRVAAAITYILDNRVPDAYPLLAGARFLPINGHSETAGSEGVPHEVGKFLYYPTSLRLVQGWLDEAGFDIVRVGSMGFISQNFYELAAHYYEMYQSDPRLLELLFRTVAAIDEYFCTEVLAGDNLQVTAVRRGEFNPSSVEYRPSGTFRDAYSVKIS